MTDSTDTAIAGMMDLLRVERDVIRNGDFDALPDMALHKAGLMERLEGVPARRLLGLHEAAYRNQRLLEAAIKGVQAAQARLKVIREAGRSYQSYDRSGKARVITPEGGTVERRA